MKETLFKAEIQKVENGFVVYLDNTQKFDRCVSDKVYVFNTLKDLADFLLTFKEIENDK